MEKIHNKVKSWDNHATYLQGVSKVRGHFSIQTNDSF